MAIPRNYQNLVFANPVASAAKQGTGWNPIHGALAVEGRQTAPDGTGNLPPSELTNAGEQDESLPDAYGFTDEDMLAQHTEAFSPVQVGTAERASWEDQRATQLNRGMTDYPSWGAGPLGTARGASIRAVNQGADRTTTPNVMPADNAAQGWLNKETRVVIEPGSGISDESQYTVQTSMRQQYSVRAGSTRGQGSASEYSQPIQTRIPGQKLKVFSTGRRLYDMTPRTQNAGRVRAFWNRTAGTGHVSWMQPNAMYQSNPLNRVAPTDPYQGPSVPLQDDSGYTYEDQVVY